VDDIPDEELWAARQSRSALPLQLHPRARAAPLDGRSIAPARVVAAGVMLDHDALTIGFARRFTATSGRS
jgi:glycogen phosphorylase